MKTNNNITENTFTITKRFLAFPIKHDAQKYTIHLSHAGKIIQYLHADISEADPEYLGYIDLNDFLGEEITISCDGEGSELIINLFSETEERKDHDNLYREALRPQIHFTAKYGWLNDPNGLYFKDGIYHLFFQHNPYDTTWGNMHWGHATSENLMDWRQEEIALFPDATGSMYSGTAIVDYANSSDLQESEHPPIILFYTAAGANAPTPVPYTQRMAYSTDNGATWKKHDKTLVECLYKANRDPKVFWHEESQKWVMALFLDRDSDRGEPHDDANGTLFCILNSNNLIDWEKTSEVTLPGTGECPDMFRLDLEDEDNDSKWVFWAADGTYMTGEFDGKKFSPESEPLNAYCGLATCKSNAYAAQTYNNIPSEDGRRIQIAWLRTKMMEGMPFGQMMTLPTEMSLAKEAREYRLKFSPAREVERICLDSTSKENIQLSDNEKHIIDESGKPLHIKAKVDVSDGGEFSFDILGNELKFAAESRTFTFNEHSAKLFSQDSVVEFELVIDRISLELFADGGLVYMPCSFMPESESVSVSSSNATIEMMDISTLRSVWNHD